MVKYIGTKVKVKVDRMLGSKHPKFGYIYPVNYGYIEDTLAGDGKEIDAYILGVHEPIKEYEGIVIGVIKRKNDIEDKLVVAQNINSYDKYQIKALTEFQERFFDTEVITYDYPESLIEQITDENIGDINKANEPFDVIGRIVVRYENDTWVYAEELNAEVYEKQYPLDVEDYEVYINSKDKTVFFYYDHERCVGQIKMHKNWGQYAFIDDILVSKKARGKGIGHALINQAIDWAKQNKLMGLMLETQDNNILACRFYERNGFRIGGIDDMLYRNFSHICNEKAIYWYLKW